MTRSARAAVTAHPENASTLSRASSAPFTVVHINTWDRIGGAARAALRLHETLGALGYDSRMLVGFSAERPEERVRAVISEWPRWKRLLRRATLGLERVSGMQDLLSWWSEEFLRHRFTQEADIVHLHNTHGGYLSPAILPNLARRKPVVWSLHDQWALTGHCAFSLECERWKTGCGKCPRLSTYPALAVDTTSILWRMKRRLYRQSDMTLVVGSRWLAGLVNASPLLRDVPVSVIPCGIDTSVFHPVPKATARQALGIPRDVKVVLCVAERMADVRKGTAFFLEALQRLKHLCQEPIWCLTIGDGLAAAPPFPHRHVNIVRDDRVLAGAFSAADVCVGPSLAESFGLVFAEAMACETPCVAFHLTALPELIRHMETGYLAAPADGADLARGIQMVLTNDDLRRAMSRRGRALIEQEYTAQRSAQRHAALYGDVIRRFHAQAIPHAQGRRQPH